jgi:hypothetical protein
MVNAWHILTQKHYTANKKDETELYIPIWKSFQDTQFSEKARYRTIYNTGSLLWLKKKNR